jgi:hypothetical protein
MGDLGAIYMPTDTGSALEARQRDIPQGAETEESLPLAVAR